MLDLLTTTYHRAYTPNRGVKVETHDRHHAEIVKVNKNKR